MASFLVFQSEKVLYAIPVESVESIFWMPGLSPIEAAPPWFVGLVNWHGEVIHVLDLSIRFKHPQRTYSSLTSIVLLSTPQMRCGVIADTVNGLIDVSSELIVHRDITLPADFSSAYSDLIYGEIKQGDDIVLLLDLEKLLTTQVGETPNSIVVENNPQADPISKLRNNEIFRERMHQLAMPIIDARNEDKEGFALVTIGDLKYAIEVAYISEFSHLRQCIPLPCSSEYLLGVINLRGQILSVIDMSTLLNIRNMVDKQDIVILDFESKKMALAVQKVEDFQYFDRQQISVLQNVEEHQAQCKALLRLDNGVAGILDIEAILVGNELEIDEHI